jgi:hypothetical protein
MKRKPGNADLPVREEREYFWGNTSSIIVQNVAGRWDQCIIKRQLLL